ncbi:MAG TPA: hypothetical protein VKJ47_24180 [Candidatus Binatia bacterium]|nr:hypothetical protein [Candidatus Binatia bacterium]
MIEREQVGRDAQGKVLVWTGAPKEQPADREEQPPLMVPARSTAATPRGEAERRRLTVMFCDLVGSTARGVAPRFTQGAMRWR